MKQHWTKLMGAGALSLSMLVAAPALAAYSDWDADQDAGISDQEFNDHFTEMGVLDAWDTNDDETISEGEFTAAVGDNDSAFEERFGENVFAEWDTDNSDALTQDELYVGVFAGYDDNNNEMLEEPEFGDLNDDLGDSGFWDV